MSKEASDQKEDGILGKIEDWYSYMVFVVPSPLSARCESEGRRPTDFHRKRYKSR